MPYLPHDDYIRSIIDIEKRKKQYFTKYYNDNTEEYIMKQKQRKANRIQCDVCKCNTSNMEKHIKSARHYDYIIKHRI